MLRSALDQMRAIRTGKEDQVIQIFNSTYKQIKEAIKRGAELGNALTEPRLQDLARSRQILGQSLSYLTGETELSDTAAANLEEQANQLRDYMARDTFFKYLVDIDQSAKASEDRLRSRVRDKGLRMPSLWKREIPLGIITYFAKHPSDPK